jgi:hypothetical protein
VAEAVGPVPGVVVAVGVADALGAMVGTPPEPPLPPHAAASAASKKRPNGRSGERSFMPLVFGAGA